MLAPRQRLVALGVIVVSATFVSAAFLITGDELPIVLALVAIFGALTIAMAAWRGRS